MAWENDFATREQAERAAEWSAYRMSKGDEIEEQTKERMIPLIVALADQKFSGSGLDRDEVLLNIRLGIEAALDKLCPSG